MDNIFAWQFFALVVGVIAYAVTLRYAYEDEGFWFGLWAILWTLILGWIAFNLFPGLNETSPGIDLFVTVCLMLTGVVHITTVICWLASM